MTPTQELIDKALGSAGFLADEVERAHRLACKDGNELLEILLLDLIRDAQKIQMCVRRIKTAIQ